MKMEHEEFPVDWGAIDFSQHKGPFKAEFIQVRPWVDKKLIIRHMDDQWQLGLSPGALFRITGNVDNLENGEKLESILSGVALASEYSKAWLFSTGLDFGVASSIGHMLARCRHKCAAPLIGVASWNSVQGRDQILVDTHGEAALRGSKRIYNDMSPDENMSTVQLQPEHSHFILVGTRDDKDEGSNGVSAEERLLQARKKSFTFAHQLEETIVAEQIVNDVHASPRVLLVLAGDKTTLEEVLTYCRIGKGVVVLASETGGLASALANYMAYDNINSDWSGSRSQFEELKALNEREAARRRAAARQGPSAGKALLDVDRSMTLGRSLWNRRARSRRRSARPSSMQSCSRRRV
jgi:hypothetical protein